MTKKEQYENELALFKFVTEGYTVDYYIISRKAAAKFNKTYSDFNLPSQWVEVKTPQHISVFLEQEFARLQQAINR
jgi:hypothetical protein